MVLTFDVCVLIGFMVMGSIVLGYLVYFISKGGDAK